MGINPDFWQNKKVFLTGHTGFKGGWLSLWLQSLGAEVHGYSLQPPTQPSFYEVAQVADLLASNTLGDIRNRARLADAMKCVQPDIVFHLAAQPLVRYSYKEPVETYTVNVLGTVNLLEAVRANPSVRAVINVTTDKCYENREWCYPYRENDPLGGHDPYSASKACAEIVTRSYRASFFTTGSDASQQAAIATVRAGNVIGGGDWAEFRLIPDCIRALMLDQPIFLRYPSAVRPWQHVLDPLAGYLMLTQQLWLQPSAIYADSWNFGPDPANEATVERVARQVVELWGYGEIKVDKLNFHPHEASLLRLDTTKAWTHLGWRSHWSLDRALRQTVEWYRVWQQEKDMQQYSLGQILAYQEGR